MPRASPRPAIRRPFTCELSSSPSLIPCLARSARPNPGWCTAPPPCVVSPPTKRESSGTLALTYHSKNGHRPKLPATWALRQMPCPWCLPGPVARSPSTASRAAPATFTPSTKEPFLRMVDGAVLSRGIACCALAFFPDPCDARIHVARAPDPEPRRPGLEAAGYPPGSVASVPVKGLRAGRFGPSPPAPGRYAPVAQWSRARWRRSTLRSRGSWRTGFLASWKARFKPSHGPHPMLLNAEGGSKRLSSVSTAIDLPPTKALGLPTDQHVLSPLVATGSPQQVGAARLWRGAGMGRQCEVQRQMQP